MAKLSLPQSLRKSLVALAAASPAQIAELQEKLGTLRPDLSNENLPDQIAGTLSKWDVNGARDAVQAVLSLCAFRAQSGQQADSLVSDIIFALLRRDGLEAAPDQEEKFVLSTDRESTLRGVLLDLFSINALDITAKALGVLTDNPRSFLLARVLSDVRPIFQEDVSIGPAAVVIVHALKIEHMEGTRRKEFFVALDSADLKSLKDTIERAIKKDEAIRRTLEKAGIALLENK